MIVWLASYPRSGNTFLRAYLERVFDVATYSIYDEDPLKYGADGIEKAAQGSAEAYDADRLYRAARDSSRLHLLKTHDAPLDDAPAIYIARDGRAACVSYYHYLRSFGCQDVTLTDVILGRVQFGSWSEHYEAWEPHIRPRTVLLRFEDLIRDINEFTPLISNFLGLRPHARYEHDWSVLHRFSSKLFRAGNNAENIAELTRSDADMFWLMHGQLMLERGYARDTPSVTYMTRDMLIEHRRRWEEILRGRHQREVDRLSIQIKEKDRELREAAARMRAFEDGARTNNALLAEFQEKLEAANADRQAKDEIMKRLASDIAVLGEDVRARGERIERLLIEIDRLKRRA